MLEPIEVFAQFPARPPRQQTCGSLEQLQVHPTGIRLICTQGSWSVQVLTPRLLRLRFSPTGEPLPRRSWDVALADEEWPPVPFQLEESPTQVQLSTALVQVYIDRDPIRFRFQDHQGQPFATDIEGNRNLSWDAKGIQLHKHLHPQEQIYGLGERAGLLNKRGRRYSHWTQDCWNYDAHSDNLYQAIPFALCLRPGLCYGLFLHCTHWSQFDLGQTDPEQLTLEVHAPELDYYLLYGPTPAQVLNTYTQLTGRTPLPPLWALGYQQCRWSYSSAAQVQAIARQFRQRHIPCDVLYLDIDYMRGYRVFTWDPLRFPDPKELITQLHQAGFQVVTIVDPGVKFDPEADYAVFDEGVAQDFFIRRADGHLFHGYVWPGKTLFPDFLRPEVRQWWGDWQKVLTQVGVAGIWNDMNEPALNDRPFGDGGQIVDIPHDAPQGSPSEPTTHAETHNLYGLMMARACREGLERLNPTQRPFVLTRSGYAGIQRWSAVWTGDNQSSWEHLEMSLPMLCNLGLSGVSFVGADIGGFGGNASPELFARWMQMGILYPLMRGHTAMGTRPHEPWCFGPEVEAICRQAIELRYQLLPYLYSLFWESSQTGAPILRPLLYEFPDDPQTYDLSDQAMLGSWLLAAPVVRPGVRQRAVYLPAGTWFDWWTGQSYHGPTHILAPAPLAHMPLFVRAGAIFPLAPVQPCTANANWDPFTLRLYPGDGSFTLYEDDGRTLNYQAGDWATTTFHLRQTEAQLLLEITPRQGNWIPANRTWVIEPLGYAPLSFRDDGQRHQLSFSPV
ncbi:glycoside hydrolase family 31 protein [Thermostichus vulcanus]|uniref:Glycoside hydrolase family 31 protein n=1 Tax=Thermostichus vulcanus str. 'Rupite' TaxID=2813851 RepID=A0ABT0CC12_THEVL|nr:glycoside hydrolase family 31 protein [Thermostichus vulcanus]MCJ2543332.1 glycoside hydrolase family 31 protein [Thermostichus vulcanus str. 'Rupite']